MAVTLEQIVEFIKVEDVIYDYNEEKKRILLISGDEDSTYTHYIRAKDDGAVFEWQMQILDEDDDNVEIKDHEHAGKVLSHMLYLNYQTKFGTWEFDPSDGDIRLAVEIPLEDAIMTQKQFHRILGYMMVNGSSAADEIMSILKTGEVPKDDSDAEMIATLEAMLAKLKGGDSDTSKTSSDGI